MSRILLALLVTTAWMDAHAQSSLPPCPTSVSTEQWTDCFGTLKLAESNGGGTYVGEFKNGRPEGRGKKVTSGNWLFQIPPTEYVGEWREGMQHGYGTFRGRDNYEGQWERDVRQVRRLTDDEVRRRAERARTVPGQRSTVSKQFDRDPHVAEHAKRIAKGICDLCLSPAPFNNGDGQPYLETHHIEWLAKGGSDTIDNTVALCPNCHRKMHILNLEVDRKLLSEKVRGR